MLGGVFLCVTGAEALYADMGHFGAKPIRRAWNFVVFPSLILNYAGQAAIVLEGAPTDGNIFYRLCPPMLLTPLIVLATVATVIASQSIITGAFSMTRQAIRLGWLPRLSIKQTSAEGYGQIYVGAVNWLLMLVTLGADDRLRQVRQPRRRLRHRGLGDHADDERAAVHRHARDLELAAAGRPARSPRLFMIVDASFFAANLAKLLDGGYVPLLLAALVYGVMWIWHRGVAAVHARDRRRTDAARRLRASCSTAATIARVPGYGGVPHPRQPRDAAGRWPGTSSKNRSLHENVLALTLTTVPTPRVAADKSADGRSSARAAISGGPRPASASWSGPTSRRCSRDCKVKGAHIDLDDVTYYVGHETTVRARGRPAACRDWWSRCSRLWAATPRASATRCVCRTTMSSRSAAKSRSSEADRRRSVGLRPTPQPTGRPGGRPTAASR